MLDGNCWNARMFYKPKTYRLQGEEDIIIFCS